MQCVECKKDIQENVGTGENPICQSCYDRMKREHAPDSPSLTKKKKPKWVTPVAVALIIVVAALSVGYYFIHTPSFALKSIASAIENHDWDKFSKFVDVESFYTTTVKGALADSDNLFAKGIGTLMASNMKEAFIDQLKTQIEQPEEENVSLFHQLFDKDNVLMAKMKTESKGKIVQLKIPRKTQYLELEIPVIFNFRKEPMHLALTSMDMSKFEKVEDKIEEIITDHYNLPIRDSLKNLVQIQTVKKYRGCSNYVFSTCVEDLLIITSRVTNRSDFTIDRVVFAVLPKYYNGNWKGAKFQQAENIKPGASVSVGINSGWKYNEYDEHDKIYMEAKKSDIHFQTKEIWRKTKFGMFEMTVPMKEEEFTTIKDRIAKDSLTLDAIISRRTEYGIDDSSSIKAFLLGEDQGV